MSPRYREPYTLLKVPRKRGGYTWYFRLADDPKRIHHSTGTSNKGEARAFVERLLDAHGARGSQTLRQYLDPFYVWERCPHVERLRAEGKNITRRHVENQRRLLELHVWDDVIAGIPLAELKRADILDFRARLQKGVGIRTVNRTIAALKTAFKEGVFREELDRNPCLGVGEIKYEAKAAGTFTVEDLRALFPVIPPGPWRDLQAYACFLLAATAGLRRGELLALRWRHIDLEAAEISVEEAWKGKDEVGAPKWGKKRREALSRVAVDALVALQGDSVRIAVDDLVFCLDAGNMLSGQWWRDCFAEAMEKIEIDVRARGLKPHSFRHTLNTMLLDAGMDPAKVRAALGWTNAATQEGYTHWEPEHFREQAEAVDRVFKEP